MTRLASSLLKRTGAAARYICPSAWWALPLSILVVGLTARIAASRLDWLDGDNYCLMRGVEEPFGEFAQAAAFHLPLLVHYWVSYRLFGGNLSDYLILPLIAGLGSLVVFCFGIRRQQWGPPAWSICLFALAILALNSRMLALARYAMFTYSSGLLISCCLFFLFLRLCSGRLTRRQWAWIAVAIVPAAFFSNLYILVPVFVGAVSVVLVRHWHSRRWLGLNDLRQYAAEMWPLAIFPVAQFAALLFHPAGIFAPLWMNIGLAAKDALFFFTSEYPHSPWGAVRFLSHRTLDLFKDLLQTPYTDSLATAVWALALVATLAVVVVLVIRMLQR
ncbi:MAG: hypothetical protein DRI40_08875, partial [Chloroflexi bacterium]